MAASIASASDLQLVAALRNGDDNAFASLIDAHHASMIRIAMIYVGDKALAEDVAQETWIAVLNGIRNFEGRSSLKTWIFGILANRAKTKGLRESRSLPFSAFERSADEEAAEFEPAVDPARFKQDGWWREGSHPHSWSESPELQVLSAEVRDYMQAAIDALPPNQCQVITLRDIEGWGSDEVCNVLGVSETNQRVLLHRARSKVRTVLEQYFAER